ncbi:MAG: hypothetical protein LBI27_01210 [Clostridiales bacterium]|jgi:hypothetical protein|nr:hypothetical protein [Clostridiales bacterium]
MLHSTGMIEKNEYENEKMENYIKQEDWKGIPRLYSSGLKNGQNYENIITTIENHISNAMIKKHVAEAFVSDASLKNLNDDYIHLQKLRIFGATPQYKPYLDYFLKSDKPFGQHYGDVIYFAMFWCEKFSQFLENMILIDATVFIENLIYTNCDIPERFLSFIKIDNHHKRNPSIKNARILSDIANIIFEIKESADQKTEYFETATRLSHEFNSMVYKAEVYSAQNVYTLSENEAFAYYAGTAYKCKDAGDILNFERNLRAAVSFNPRMKDIIRSIAKATPENPLR